MATNLNYDATHSVSYPSKMLASNGAAHILNVQLTGDCDNGSLIGLGDFIDLDLYEEAAATTFEGKIQKQAANGNWYIEVVDPGDSYYVYTVPFIAEEWTKSFKDLKRWFNASGSTVRAYQMCKHDVFELSAEGFAGTPEAGKTVTVEAKKLKVNA